jgi:diguanylate cyclase (GGDEF)-like protein
VNSLNGLDADLSSLSHAQYEPWLFQSMLDELVDAELGIKFIYSLMDQLAKRHALHDVVVVLEHETLGYQAFRLGGQTVGVSEGVHDEPGVYCEPDVVPVPERDAVRTACQLSLQLHLARFSAAHDPLTNLANRRNFDASLQTSALLSARNGWAFTLVLIDLKDFKVVNDRSGHDFGDQMLRQFGFALRLSVRRGDVAARIGGDEFAVILNNAEGNESLSFIDRLRANLTSNPEYVDFTTGTATSPRDSVDALELFRIADARLYAKRGIIHR